jgi:hypothetical protein
MNLPADPKFDTTANMLEACGLSSLLEEQSVLDLTVAS